MAVQWLLLQESTTFAHTTSIISALWNVTVDHRRCRDELNWTEHLQTFWNFNHSIWRTHVAFAAKDINKMSLLCRALINFVFVLFLSLQVQMDCEDAVDRLTLGTKRWSWRRNSTQIIIWHGEDASKWLMHSASPSDRYACTFIRPMNNFRIYPWQNSCSSVSYSYTPIELEI